MIQEKRRARKDERIYRKTKKYLERMKDERIEEKMLVVKQVLFISDYEKRYSYLYDLICDYLDNEFRSKNICGFDCGICKRRKDMMERKIKKVCYENGCCRGYKEGKTCKYLIPNVGCSIKNIACKTYTCFYLRKQGYRYKLNNIYLVRYFFNLRQKFYIENTFFVDKNVIIDGILKRR